MMKRMRGFLLALLFACLFSTMAHAAAAPPEPKIPRPVGTCTSDPSFDIPSSSIVQDVERDIRAAIDGLAKETFDGFAQGVGLFITSVLSIYVIVYGILFLSGGVAHTGWEASARVAKGAFVAMAIGGGSTGTLFSLMQKIFETSVTELLAALGGSPANVDVIAAKIVSAKMLVTLLAALTTGPYGIILGGLIVLSLKSIIMAILQAAWIYLMALVVRALLYGVAPIFIPCILFSRTRHMFDGWLNQLVGAALQPIFLFSFLGFFLALTGTLVDDVMSTPVCWSAISGAAKGSPFLFFGWKFTVGGELFSGSWGPDGPMQPGSNTSSGPMYPINILNILIFFMLAELLGRFNSIVLTMASGIASAGSTSLASVSSMFSNWGSPPANKEKPVSANAEQNAAQARRQGAVGVGRR